MKLIPYIPPVVALVIVGGWIGSERQSLATLEKESVLLRKRIAAAHAPASTSAQTGKPSPDKLSDPKQPLDWKKLAAQMEEMQRSGGMGDMRTMLRLQQRITAMSKEEILASLDEVAAMDISAQSKQMLQGLLMGPLIEKDPELALTRFSSQFQGDLNGMSYQLANAFTKWAEKDMAKATAWFEQQIADGNFDSKSLDGKSQTRLRFEGALISALISSDPEAAAKRLGALPEDQRSQALQYFQISSVKESDQLAYAKLIREQVPEKEQGQVLSQMASRVMSGDGYLAVTALMDRIQATPAERASIAGDTASSKIQQLAYQKGITREDIDSMREWVSSQAPGTADSTTGKVLANATQGGGGFKFTDAAALAVQYHESSGNDDVLVSFLAGWPARQHKEEARLLAEKISDETRRADVLKNLK
ncbi:MAG: hypothetical protein ABI600_18615 [Luteolibacter sp.]